MTDPHQKIQEIVATDCQVVLASIHHTGTWYCLELLKTCEGIEEVVELREYLDGTKDLGSQSILHLHLTGHTIHSRGVVDGWALGHVKYLASRVPTLTPLRDPMTSLISRWQRHPEADHNLILDGFLHLYELEDVVHFLRLDGPRPPFFRQDVERVLEGLDLTPTQETWDYLARDPRPNSRGRYPLKVLYELGHVLEAGSFFPAEFRRLLGMKYHLAPLLRREGYHTMPWWAYAI